MGVCTSRRDRKAAEVPRVVDVPALKKRISDMNLVPGEANMRWYKLDESDYDRERDLLVLASPISSDKAAKIMIFNVHFQNRYAVQKVSELVFPNSGDELQYACWARGAKSAGEINSITRSSLVVPCFNTSRIYIVGIDTLHQMRFTKIIELKDNDLLNLSFPLYCFSCPNMGNPLFLSNFADKNGQSKGTVVNLDRRLFTFKNDMDKRESKYGGTFAIHPRQNVMITTEWGSSDIIQHGLEFDESYENLLNVWEVEPRLLRQQICLDDFDGRLPICVRFLHNPELVHAFVCTLYGSIYHLHKNSITDSFTARKAFRFADAHTTGWIREEVPAVPVDMVISMDDQYLYVSTWLQGCVYQFNIVDPYNVTLAHSIFLGGIIHKEFGIKLQRISTINFTPTRRCFQEAWFEGGPSRLQLSLDGRRLFVGNSWISSWDRKYYPRLEEQGSMIVLIHINVNCAGAMNLDEHLCIKFSDNKQSNDSPYFVREMKFLNGDCTSDAFI